MDRDADKSDCTWLSMREYQYPREAISQGCGRKRTNKGNKEGCSAHNIYQRRIRRCHSVPRRKRLYRAAGWRRKSGGGICRRLFSDSCGGLPTEAGNYPSERCHHLTYSRRSCLWFRRDSSSYSDRSSLCVLFFGTVFICAPIDAGTTSSPQCGAVHQSVERILSYTETAYAKWSSNSRAQSR